MRYYFAPMEGLTDSVYRRLHHQFFPGVHTYYMPFISPTIHRSLTNREAREIPLAQTEPFRAVPQLMTKVPEDFLWAAQECQQRGYDEVNLNAGCPSGTVVSKKKGAGMLEDPDALDRFLDSIFRAAPIPISIKTRLGMTQSEEFPRILEIYNQYPIKELTIHPRVRQQFYEGAVDMQMLYYALENSKNPICYNGNLCTMEECHQFEQTHPQIDALMIGRGLIGNPAMLCGGADAQTLKAFHDALLDEYTHVFGSARNAMFRMKENWRYLLPLFDDSEKLGKRLRKTTDIQEFRLITSQIFDTRPLRSQLQADW